MDRNQASGKWASPRRGPARDPDQEPDGSSKLRFLLGSAHQCRSPLNTAHTSLATLLQGYAGELPGKHRRLLEGADRKVRLALAIINDMLTMNTLTAENVLEFFEAVNLRISATHLKVLREFVRSLLAAVMLSR